MADSILASLFSAIESGKRRVKNALTDEGMAQTADVLNQKLENLTSKDSEIATKEALDLFSGGVTGTIGSAVRVLGPEAAAKAQILLSKGMKNEDVFNQTKVYEGPLDKQLRAVISDEGMRLNPNALKILQETGKARMGDVVRHPELYKVYPGLQQVELELRGLGKDAAAYKFDPKTQRETIFLDPSSIRQKTIYGHEIQHAIQEFEDFTRGGNPRSMIQHPDYGKFVSEEGQDLSKQKSPSQNVMEAISNAMYRLLGGEAEARAVERQILMNDYTSFPAKRLEEGGLYDVDPAKVLQDMRRR